MKVQIWGCWSNSSDDSDGKSPLLGDNNHVKELGDLRKLVFHTKFAESMHVNKKDCVFLMHLSGET
jgi:hypothetical protein